MSGHPVDTIGDLKEAADAAERDGNATGMHPKEERAPYAARALQSRWLTRYLYRLDDDRGVDSIIRRARAARAHPYVQARLDAGSEPLGSADHLTDIMYRQAKEHVHDAERRRLAEIEADAPNPPSLTPIQSAAKEAGISRTTEWRRRKRAQQQAAA